METKRRPRMKEQVDSIKSHTEFRRTDTEVRLDLTNRRLFTTPEREFSPVEEARTDFGEHLSRTVKPIYIGPGLRALALKREKLKRSSITYPYFIIKDSRKVKCTQGNFTFQQQLLEPLPSFVGEKPVVEMCLFTTEN